VSVGAIDLRALLGCEVVLTDDALVPARRRCNRGHEVKHGGLVSAKADSSPCSSPTVPDKLEGK
jgi:hypothetical protein